MPITPSHRSDLLVALLRAKCPRDYFLEDEWLEALRPFGYADPGELLRDAIREKLLVRDYQASGAYRYRLADQKLEHYPVPVFYERTSQRPLPASTLYPVPKPKKTPAWETAFKPLWGDDPTPLPPPPPHPLATARVSYFRAPALDQVPVPPAPCPARVKRGDATLAQVHAVVTAAPARLVQATEVVGRLHGSALAAAVAGTLDQVAFGGVWTATQGLTTPVPLVALVLTVDPARLSVAEARQRLRADPYLEQPLRLLYGHEATHRLVVVLDASLVDVGVAATDDDDDDDPEAEAKANPSAVAQYLEYFTHHHELPGLQAAEPPADELGRVLCPVWSDPAGYLHPALWPSAPAAEQA